MISLTSWTVSLAATLRVIVAPVSVFTKTWNVSSAEKKLGPVSGGRFCRRACRRACSLLHHASGVPSRKESIGKGRVDEGGKLSAEDAGRASGKGRAGAISESSTRNAGLALGGGRDLVRRDAGDFSE